MSRVHLPFLTILALLSTGRIPANAEIPLPDATFYGNVVDANGGLIEEGRLSARIQRQGRSSMTVEGAFVRDQNGVPFYIVRIPLETNIGAPGVGIDAAHEGDELDAIFLDGSALEFTGTAPALAAGLAIELDATAGATTGPRRLFRGDCNDDLGYNLTDPVLLLNFLFLGGRTPDCLAACDANNDGTLELTDAVLFLSNLFLGGVLPAAPSGQCGSDINPSVLSCDGNSC